MRVNGRWWVAFAAAAIAAAAPPALGLWRIARKEEWVTMPRLARFVGPQGPVSRVSCQDEDFDFDGLIWDGAIWTSCGGMGLARIDPARGVVELRWPTGLDGHRTAAFMPGPGGQLAYAYWSRTGTLFAGVAGPTGWTMEPRRVDRQGDEARMVLGIGWRGDAIELVLARDPRGSDRERGVFIARLGPPGAVDHRPQKRAEHCPPRVRCRPVGAVLGPAGWRVLVWRGFDGADIIAVAENGRETFAGVGSHDEAGEIDVSIQGIPPDRSAAIGWRLGADGKIVRAPVGQRVSQSFRVTGDRIHMDPTLPEGDHRVQQMLDGRPIVFHDDVGILAIEEPATGARRAVSRTQLACPRIHLPVVLPRAEGGYWLVDPAGACYLAVDRGRRADPLGIVDHLRRGQGVYAQDDRTGERWLAFILFGLPVLAATGIGLALVISRIRHSPRPITMVKTLTAIFGLYAAIAIWQLIELYPRMR